MSSFSSPYVEALRSFYNAIGKRYNGLTGSLHSESAQRLVTAAGSTIKAGSWVLDLATGTGNVAFAAASRVGRTGRVLGIDISDDFLELASQEAKRLGVGEFVDFLQQNVSDLSLPEPYAGRRCFDVVTCGSAIAMIPSPEMVLAMAATELLKPGGIFVADMHGTHVPAKIFLDVAVPLGFESPIDPVWLSDPQAGFHKIFKDSIFELKALTASNVSLEAKWDASTAEATEKLWESIIVDSTWISFGVDKLDSKVIAEIKQAWAKKLSDYKGPDGVIVAEMKQYLAVAISKSE
ncbi:S-adenosyl-L-methionine-dependent methyltransferase [Lindgomyces ingoldianus]|uniref:S-adenosyl-L-methionine-dependent methyltransferase n=1 Tax=Lindgomyces ingoldianus TaxID=673940 RepID=A0ACB6QCC3_9PLEO|nr:S-adenosyl-L-methionine-dependent methyltransferase [Lindgomyces ingoldianus]KAF2464546.1 S-adenosyl-L-methionine-dependent methyltransferase [Lindgomyces ingoldianus]